LSSDCSTELIGAASTIDTLSLDSSPPADARAAANTASR
jgi:hypothetical protein